MSGPLNILITGGAGLVGPLLAARLLNATTPSYHVFLTDLADPVLPANVAHPERATLVKGDITSPEFVTSLITAALPLHAVFLFHGIMSAGSEADPDLSLRVNFDSMRLVAETLRHLSPGVRVVYASSVAIYGQPLPRTPEGVYRVDPGQVVPTPESTYGAHKLMTEVYLHEMHRRGFLDVFVTRFPTISVRPGRPTGAASSFLSGIIREPMKGEVCVVPMEDRGFRSYLASPMSVIENLVRVLGMESDVLPRSNRRLQFPGVSVSIQELMDALAKHGGEEKLALIREARDERLEGILRSWPQDFDVESELGLGLVADGSADDLVREYVESLKTGHGR